MSFCRVIFSYSARASFMSAENHAWDRQLPSGVQTADAVYKALTFELFESDVFFDWRSLRDKPGTVQKGNQWLNPDWEEYYNDALQAASVVVIFYDFEYENSKWCMEELLNIDTESDKKLVIYCDKNSKSRVKHLLRTEENVYFVHSVDECVSRVKRLLD
eukprot:Colp12_sorted_trinity150504_noHs@16015